MFGAEKLFLLLARDGLKEGRGCNRIGCWEVSGACSLESNGTIGKVKHYLSQDLCL